MHKALFCLTLVCLGVPCVGAPVCADVVPAFLFNDNAVLQRDKPIPVWGTADAGEKVSVAFAGYTVATAADATGKWRVNFPALPANASPTNLVIKGKNTVTRANIAPVRYAGRDALMAGLNHREGLPAVPFRSDDWAHTGE
jgi:hypothetical protein